MSVDWTYYKKRDRVERERERERRERERDRQRERERYEREREREREDRRGWSFAIIHGNNIKKVNYKYHEA